jgi:hypothetical protein
MSSRKRVRTVLYGDQELLPGELDLLHTPALQRLYDLHQLGMTDRVYIDASHSRLHHVLGVLHQVDGLIAAIDRNVSSGKTTTYAVGRLRERVLGREEVADRVRASRPIARLIGLLHDLTHAPYGHTVEDEIHIVLSKHDEPSRQAESFFRLVCQYLGWLGKDLEADSTRLAMPRELSLFLRSPEGSAPSDLDALVQFGRRLLRDPSRGTNAVAWRLPPGEVDVLLANLSFAMTALVHLEALHGQSPGQSDFPDPSGYAFRTLIDGILADAVWPQGRSPLFFDPHVDAYLLDVVGNTVCADLLDYAQRDAHFANLKLSYDAARIAENFTVVAWDPSKYVPADFGEMGTEPARRAPFGIEDPFSGRSLRAAISLFSHKLRTDVPGELMHLLNVRFHLYERVIFHPTKTAAGAMLGTALQLVGWRIRSTGPERDTQLPPSLRYLGDAVFLHEVRQAALRLDELLRHIPRDTIIDAEFLVRVLGAESKPSVTLVLEVVGLRVGDSVAEVQDDLGAAIELLGRLAARRYFRPVFRVMPDLSHHTHGYGADTVCETFRDPDTRFAVERKIEHEVGLPRGSIVIHCPKRNTAEKIANVLLVLVEHDVNVPSVYKLQHIRKFSDGLFGDHQAAIDSVTKMYRSMWRLAVFASPPHLARWRDIASAAGREIARAIDSVGCKNLENDPWLAAELDAREADGTAVVPNLGPTSDPALEPIPLAEAIHVAVERASQGTGQSGSFPNILAEECARLCGMSTEQSARIAEAMIRMQSLADPSRGDASRCEAVWAMVSGYVGKGLGRKSRAEFDDRFRARLDRLPARAFAGFLGELRVNIDGTPNLSHHRDDRYKHVLDRVNELPRVTSDEVDDNQ